MTLLVLPSPELQAHIRESLNEDVDTRQRDLEIIKTWLSQQPHLPKVWDDQILMSFLRGCNFRLEKCKKKLDMYCTMKNAVPEFFANRDMTHPDLTAVVKYIDAGVLPRLTPAGLRVTVLRATQSEFESIPDLGDAMKLILMIGDARMLIEKTGVAGDVYILDASVATTRNFASISPAIVKKFMICVQEAYPVKLKQVHVININPVVQIIFTWIKPFLKEKIKGRIYMHSKIETLYEHIPKDMLPDEYGGSIGSIRKITDGWVEKLIELGPWLREQDNFKADESKRPGKSMNYDELFGVEGSFKKLNID